jgi:radical SAM enzyme (TIGR01210 family)
MRRLELYVSGSFFDEQEVSEQSTDLIAQLIAGSTVNEVVLESRPEYITQGRLKALTQHLDPSRVTLAVGVETMNDELRSRLRKNFSTDDVVRSIEAVAQAGMGFQAYLLLNPPLINDDRAAIVDVLTSSKRILRLTSRLQCKTTLAIQPYFVAKESTVAQRLSAGSPPRPPWLYTIALVLGLLDAIRGEDVPPFQIILGNEVDNVDTLCVPANYAADGGICNCTDVVRQLLREVNISRDTMRERVQQVLAAPCECREAWEQQIVAGARELASAMPDTPW